MRLYRNNAFSRVNRMKRLASLSSLTLAIGASFAIPRIEAGERRFTYVYEATTAAKGEIEIENWMTWKTQREVGERGNELDYRHEIEFGLTDRLQVGVYVADWKVLDKVAGGEDGAQAVYQDSAVEVIYNLTNPVDGLHRLGCIWRNQTGRPKTGT